jgi:putative transposase
MASGCVYSYRKVHHDLYESGDSCSKSRVECLMKHYKLKAQVGYKKRRYMNSGELGTVAPNILKRQFDVGQPNQSWVTDITYIRTYEGWFYLAVVLDLFLRQIIGWSMQSRMEVDLVMRALIMALRQMLLRKTTGLNTKLWPKLLDHYNRLALSGNTF